MKRAVILEPPLRQFLVESEPPLCQSLVGANALAKKAKLHPPTNERAHDNAAEARDGGHYLGRPRRVRHTGSIYLIKVIIIHFMRMAVRRSRSGHNARRALMIYLKTFLGGGVGFDVGPLGACRVGAEFRG